MHITERAMLAHLNISLWGNRRYDSGLSREIAEKHGAPPDAGRYNKRLLPKEATAKINAAAAAARAHHYENTLPWLDSGARILPSANYFPYVGEYNRLKAEFERQANIFAACYPVFVEEARRGLNGMFRREDYPPPAGMRRRFAMELSIDPLPSAQDFRVSLDEAETQMIKGQLEERLQKGMRQATEDLFTRIHEAVAHLRDSLAARDAEPERTVRFHDSTIGNLRELTALLPRLNLANDPRLDTMCRELEQSLCTAEPDDLRKSETLRKAAIADAGKLLERIAGYTGGEASP